MNVWDSDIVAFKVECFLHIGLRWCLQFTKHFQISNFWFFLSFLIGWNKIEKDTSYADVQFQNCFFFYWTIFSNNFCIDTLFIYLLISFQDGDTSTEGSISPDLLISNEAVPSLNANAPAFTSARFVNHFEYSYYYSG